MKIHSRSHVWPYEIVEATKPDGSKKITLSYLETVADMTGSSLKEVFGALRIIRNAHELGLIELGNSKNVSPESAFFRSFMLSNGEKEPDKEFVNYLVKRYGGIEGFAVEAVDTLMEGACI